MNDLLISGTTILSSHNMKLHQS